METKPLATIGSAVIICNGDSAKDYKAPIDHFSITINAGFLAHTKENGQPVDCAWTVDAPSSLRNAWREFTGHKILAEHNPAFPWQTETFKCEEIVRETGSATFAILAWLIAKKCPRVLIVGMDALWGKGHAGLIQEAHLQGCRTYMGKFPGGLFVRYNGADVRVTEEWLVSIPRNPLLQAAPAPVAKLNEPANLPKRRPMVIGYYTTGTPYEDEAKKLRLSLDGIGYEYRIEGVPNLGSWQKNTQFKPQFIQRKLAEIPGPLLYLDVDALVIQKPLALDTIDCDLAATYFGNSDELLSGTLYLANTANCRAVVKRWVDLCAQYPDVLPDGRDAWDQRVLQLAIAEVPGVRLVKLPQEYTWIVELTQSRYPGLNPVIIHTRGSYRFKDAVDRQKPDADAMPWVAWPTCNPQIANKTAQRWMDRGYRVALLAEKPIKAKDLNADYAITQNKWDGFAAAANKLCAALVKRKDAKVVIIAGDDVYPDPQHCGAELQRRFCTLFPDGMGVFQPTGDAFGAYDTCCISPWIGTEFIRRAYGGEGPYHQGYFHYWADKELQDVAIKLGCFRQDPRICQRHEHWTRTATSINDQPKHLEPATAKGKEDEALYHSRKKAGFPAHELAAVCV